MKKILTLLSLTIAGGALVLGSAISTAPKKASEAKADAPSYQTYISVRDEGWMERMDNLDHAIDYGGFIRGRNDRFWNGNADPNNFDSQERTYNGLDEFIDTCKVDGNGWTGNYRTPELTLHDNDHRYICFLYSGLECNEIFINVFNISKGRDVITNYKPFFAETPNGTFDDNKVKTDAEKKYGEITCNQTFRYLELPNDIEVNERFLLYVHDGSTAGFGFFTFGALYVNQTLTEVAKRFSAHKTQMQLNKELDTSAWNNNAIDYVLNFYATDSYYSTVRTAVAALTDADDDFEVNTHLSNWGYDQKNSTYANGDLAGLNFSYVYSDKDIKWGGYFYENDGLMPVNKTGSKFFTGEPIDVDSFNTGLPEDAKYRLVSPEFTLSGTGLISAKIGGHYAKLSLLDSSYNVLLSTGNNPSFVDASMNNIIASGARLCTMTRTYLDCSPYLNQRVHVAIEDSQTGGGWGLAYFDEIVTRYNSLPSFKLDVIQQEARSGAVYHGVVMDKLVVGETYNATFKASYDFVQTYYAQVRSGSNRYSWCNVSLDNLKSSYNSLDSDVKAIVDASDDYHYGDAHGQYTGDYFLAEVNHQYKIGQSMNALINGIYPALSSNTMNLGNLGENSTIVIISIASLVSVSLIAVFIFFKKKRTQE